MLSESLNRAGQDERFLQDIDLAQKMIDLGHYKLGKFMLDELSASKGEHLSSIFNQAAGVPLATRTEIDLKRRMAATERIGAARVKAEEILEGQTAPESAAANNAAEAEVTTQSETPPSADDEGIAGLTDKVSLQKFGEWNM